MSQTVPPDPEVGGRSGGPDEHRDPSHPTATMTNQPSQGESNIGESSGLLFSVYSKAAEDVDNKMVENWHKDAEGILIFTGLFSAAVAALLAVTVMDLRPSSQDTSAFYLGNIYQVLADPNATRTSAPSPVVKPPSFSPSRSAVWVNSLWFLSLVMSLSCALWAISLQQWARRYLRRAQPARCSPEKRARMRAFFVEGVEKMHIQWAVEGLPMLLHISLFLFFGGVAIFLFSIDREVFGYVFWWIGLFCLVYGLITVLPIIRHDSPYHSPLSTPAWFLYTGIPHVTFRFLAFITLGSCWSYRAWKSCKNSSGHFLERMLGGVEKAAEETASERSSEIDVKILEWTISALGDDDSLKSFFEAIPRSFNSKVLEHLKTDTPWTLRYKIRSALEGFCDRTLASNSISDSEKVRRLDIFNNALNQISGSRNRLIDFLYDRVDELPQTIEMVQTVASWFPNNGQDHIHADVKGLVGSMLINVRERNDSWVTLAVRTFGIPERDIRDNIALGGDNVLLAILIHITRPYICPDDDYWRAFEALTKFDIRNALPRLQHDFCTLWNGFVQAARYQGRSSTPVRILRQIRLAYIALHQGTDAAPTAFDASTHIFDAILYEPSSYPLCTLASHHPNLTTLPTQPSNPPDAFPPTPTDGRNTASRQAEPVDNVIEPTSSSNPATTSEIRATSRGHDMAPPIHFSTRPKGVLPMAVVAAVPQDVTSTGATLPHSPENSDTVAASAEPGTNQIILSTASTQAPTSSLARTPTSLLSIPPESHHACVASISASASHFAPPFISFPIPASPPTGSATFPRLRARGLVNTKNICFANGVLQLLANSPPFSNLFRELADLNLRRGTEDAETGGGATPLVDATVRFFKEYTVEEQSRPDSGETSSAYEDKKDDGVFSSFEPTYLYDAMKDKRQLKSLLDGQQQDAEEFLSLYLDALDEELPSLLASIRCPRSARAALVVDEHEMSRSDQTEVGSQGFETNFVKSPITHIFGGKFHLPVRGPNQPDPVLTEDWRSLHLDIQSDSILTIQDALMGVSQSQSMQDGRSGLSDASQQMLIEALPPVLVLHLKRFQYDAAAGSVIKIGKRVQISSELEIPFDIMVPDTQRTSEAPRYKLFGVLYHHGESAGNGHYTVDVLHLNGDGDTGEVWLHIDDETMTRMGREDVFGEHGERVADERCAYLLFYCRTSPM